MDDEITRIHAGEIGVGEQFGPVEVLQRLIEVGVGEGVARVELDIGADRVRLETLVARHVDRADQLGRRWCGNPRGRGRGGGRRRRGLRGDGHGRQRGADQ